MDIVFWIILIVLIVGVVWWLLNRSNSSSTGDSTSIRTDGGLAGGSAAASAEAAGTTGIPSAAGFDAAEPAPPTTADEPPERSRTAEPQEVGASREARPGEARLERDTVIGQDAGVERGAAASADTPATAAPERKAAEELSSPGEPAGQEEPTAGEPGSPESVSRQADDAEWETQWSEASAPTPAAASHRPAGEAAAVIADIAETPPSETPPAQGTGYAHHPEYTEPHAPTLPGAETAAAEAVDADVNAVDSDRDAATMDSGQAAGTTGAAVSTEAAEPPAMEPAAVADDDAAPEPTGHLAVDHPYGAGSASPGPDGSGPADFDVKADAGAMVYYEEGHPDYEQTKADVWFESAAHAEAAGFRAPRRTRI